MTGVGDMKQNCAYFNMKLTPRGTKMPFDTTKNTETCCQALTCKEYSENPESGITTGVLQMPKVSRVYF